MRNAAMWVSVVTAVVLVAGLAMSQGDKADQKRLRHVVLFKFKDTAKPEDIKTVVDAFRALPAKIPVVKRFEFGTNVSPENLAQGFTHCFFLTFGSDADRDAYIVHPEHKKFGELLHPYLDKVLVIDYWAEK